MGVGDFNEVSKNLIEPDLKTGDSGAYDFLGLEVCHPFLPGNRNVTQLVQIKIITLLDNATLLCGKGKLLFQCCE